jgi:hypothetical protein
MGGFKLVATLFGSALPLNSELLAGVACKAQTAMRLKQTIVFTFHSPFSA